MINNAGFGLVIPSFAETKVEQFDEPMNVHFKGVFFLTQQLLPLINNGGGIVNISTGLPGLRIPVADICQYEIGYFPETFSLKDANAAYSAVEK